LTTERKKTTLAEKIKAAKQAIKAINEATGAPEDRPVVYFADDPIAIENNTVRFIPTPCMELNEQISGKKGIGGFPIGMWTILSGMFDSGKTGLALETIGKQMAADPSFMALWIESENSVNEETLDLYHIDRQRTAIATMDAREGGEAVLDRAESLINTGSFDMIVINSLRALTPKAIINKPVSEDTMAIHARMNAKFFAKFTPLIAEMDMAGVIVQHLTTQIGTMSRDPLTLSGGQQIRYQNMLQLDLRKQSIGDGDPIGKEEGMKVMVYVRKNHISPSKFPYAKIVYYVIYGQGIETKLALLQRGLDLGVLTKSGAYIKFTDKETGEIMSWQGKQAFRNALSDPDLYKKIEDACGGLNEEITQEEVEELEQEKPAKRGRKKKEESIDAAG
jgi:recombination protein RecA